MNTLKKVGGKFYLNNKEYSTLNDALLVIFKNK